MSSSRMCSRWSVAGAVALALVAVLFTPMPAAAATGTTTRESVASDGAQANSYSAAPSLSADGRYMAFASYASNLVQGDTNGQGDAFVRDISTGTTSRVSEANDGSQSVQGSSAPTISADGRFVAFASSGNLIGEVENNVADIYVHNRKSGVKDRVTWGLGTATSPDRSSFSPTISSDGRYVAFESQATNLVAGDTNNARDIFVSDRTSGVISRVSISSLVAGQEGRGDSVAPSISAGGRYVAFQSLAPNLVPGDVNNNNDAFVHDRETGMTTLVPLPGPVKQGALGSWFPKISGDGRYVAFHAFVPGDTTGAPDVFVHDRTTGTTTEVSVASDGTRADQGSDAGGVAITPDGRYVTYDSFATNLVPGDTNGQSSVFQGQDVFLHDRVTGTTKRVSVANDGTQANGRSQGPAISADGRLVAFYSASSNLVTGDTNGTEDVFLHDTEGLPVISVGDVTVHEGDVGVRSAMFIVSLSRPAYTAVTVAYATGAGTAGGTDFTAKTGTLTFAPGVTSLTVKVPVTGDTTDEGDESFTLTLSSPSGTTVVDETGVGTILDDDPATVTGRRLAIGDVSVHEGDAGGRAAVFTVSMSEASTSYVWVNYATAKGTAIGTDFTVKSGSLSFAPGMTSLTVKVPITADDTVEGDESFTVKLSAASGAAIADATGLGTIIDND